MVTVRRGSVLDVRGPEGFCQPLLTLDKYISWRVGRVTSDSLSFLLRSDLVTELNHYRTAEDRFSDSVELYKQLLWQVELPQLENEVQPLLGLF